jgi:adenosylhomocysteinase
VDPIKAIEAHLDGFDVTNISKAAETGELFVTCTGQKNVISFETIRKMRDGAILANAGHFNVEIDAKSLLSDPSKVRKVRPHVDQIMLPNGKKVYLIGEGRLVNLVTAEGSPPEVMQMSFANQFRATIYLHENHRKMEPRVYDVPEKIDQEIAHVSLESLGITIGRLTDEQRVYAKSWQN